MLASEVDESFVLVSHQSCASTLAPTDLKPSKK